MTVITGSGVSLASGVRVQSDSQVRGTIDVDARMALQVRWQYWKGQLDRAIMTENAALETRSMAVLVAIETEADAAGLIDDLDTGECDTATGVRKMVTAMTAKVAHGHHAEVLGRYTRLNYLVSIPRAQRKSDVADEGDVNLGFTIQPAKPGKVRVDVMALGVKTQVPVEAEAGVQHQVPVSQVGKTAGQPLSKAPGLTVSKAEQLKAMKKAEAATPAGQAKVKAAKVAGEPRTKAKTKFVTKCLDGCGQDCGGRFAIGHDAKLKSVLSKIERGQLDVSEVPEIAKPFVKFGKPIKVATEDGKGHTMTYPLTMAPVRFPGREDIEYVQDLGPEFGNK